MNELNLKYRYVIMLAKKNKMKNHLFINKQNESLLCQILKDYWKQYIWDKTGYRSALNVHSYCLGYGFKRFAAFDEKKVNEKPNKELNKQEPNYWLKELIKGEKLDYFSTELDEKKK